MDSPFTGTPHPERRLLAAAGWPDATLPDYAGGSIANLPWTLLEAFGIPPETLPPLRADVLDPAFFKDARVVVLLVIDALGLNSFEWARERQALAALAQPLVESRLTSVFPSTTAAALTTLQTGYAPSQHGIPGYTLYLAAQVATVNMVTWKPVGGGKSPRPMPEPKGFLGVPNIYQRLAKAGIETSIVSHLAFVDSALTNLQSAGVPYSGHRTPAEFAGLLLREAQRPGQRFVFGYWDGFDALSHTYGPQSDTALNELAVLDRALGRGFFEPLAGGDGDVTVLLVADHGHVPLSQEGTRSLKDVLKQHNGSGSVPAGDRRGVGLPFDDEAGIQAVRALAGEDGVILPVADVIAAGLYGPEPLHPELEQRIGKTLLIARGDAAFTIPQSNNYTAGGHGSLTAEEMLVPLLGWRF